MSELPRNEASTPPLPRAVAWLHATENALLALVLLAMLLLPLAESLLRTVWHVGISGNTALVQHLTLCVGMFGGVVAAREGRLLALSTLQHFVRGRARALARVFAHAVAAGVAFWLTVAGVLWVRAVADPAKTLVYGLPLAVVQALLPAGFALLALRLVWHAGSTLAARLACLVLTVGLSALCWQAPWPAAQLMTPMLVLLGFATLLGTPLFATIGGAAMLLFWGATEDGVIAQVAVDHYALVSRSDLPSLPLFTLAGYFLAEGGSAPRIVRLFQALVGPFRGGTAIVTALACAFFTTFTGASGVTILAVGGLLMPVLLQAGYREKTALGLLTGAGSLGLLFPPCLPLILYALVAQIPLEQMFLGGVLPGVLLVIITALWGAWHEPKRAADAPGFRPREAAAAIASAWLEILLPAVALVGLFGGFAKPVEAAAMTALYALIVALVHEPRWSLIRRLPRVIAECGLLIGGVLLILGVANMLTHWLVDQEVPAAIVEFVQQRFHTPWTFLLGLNLLLLVVGCLMDVFSAIILVVPLILPLGVAFGLDPVHLGIVVLANLELGYLTPPVGMNLFLASYRFGKPLPLVYRAAVPMIVVLGVGVLVITYVPWLSTWLPALARK